ncbi:D-alanine--D-alanine ligase [Salinibacterium sp. NSLL150]|uniref:D-alanine--D-alanine ligase family protein n=1 Tax=unclassified Salinibacterium TaxID=2632331 RepID=UPI0018CEA5BB|nr:MULTISPECIES: D-alanine--D-alanine ligase [unclassified Salinibacterium]MBH0097753.1 D-alanine--D-alanine ligase [Salinibacterium sp. NSLL35]MBH0100508.1 D-alanine--D-alanine ligase [Salinibacterium sp. NSLL150]MBH0103267.1 D-alanine--D-alanine ligase [Salinibacterium sp. NSLL16]MBH0106028.1 D-alanine--D-alanine ligase [Salinibacterium sp. NSLL17]
MNDSPTRVLVLAGGISHERDVSLRSGRRVADGLRAQGKIVELRDPDATLLPYIRESKPDVVWPALHGASGEDGALRGLLDLIGIPYVGSRADAARLAWDKPTAKALVSRVGVRTPLSIALSRDSFRELGAHSILDELADELSGDLVVKPAQGGSAQGVSIVTDRSDLPQAMVNAYNYCDVALIEQRITGVEIAIGILDSGMGPVALPAVEIEPVDGAYTFEARYNAGQTRFYTPARISDGEADRAAEAALAAHSALGLRHLSRVDLIVDGAGTPWFLEANVLPGLTETSILPQALVAAGHDLGWVYAALADIAMEG